MQRLSGYWQQFLGIVDTSQGEGDGILRKKFWLCLYLQSLLNTIHFRTGINTHVFYALRYSLQKMSEKDRYCCLLFDEMSIRENGLIRNLTALRDMRILEVRAGRATLQIVLCSSWSVVCIRSGSNQWLTTSVVEVLSLRCLCSS